MPPEDGVTPVRENHRFDEARLEHICASTCRTFAVLSSFDSSSAANQILPSCSKLLMRVSSCARSRRGLCSRRRIRSSANIESSRRSRRPMCRSRASTLCEDAGVIGTAFFVMDFVEGRIMRDPMMPDSSPHERAACYDSMNDVLARLHKIDFRRSGSATTAGRTHTLRASLHDGRSSTKRRRLTRYLRWIG